VFAAIVLSACSRGEPSEVTVELNKPTRVNGCNAWLREVTIKPDAGWLKWACNVPESAPNWWGDSFEPPAATILEGDCVRLGEKFYCVKDIDPEEMSATLVVTYKGLTDEQIRPIR